MPTLAEVADCTCCLNHSRLCQGLRLRPGQHRFVVGHSGWVCGVWVAGVTWGCGVEGSFTSARCQRSCNSRAGPVSAQGFPQLRAHGFPHRDAVPGARDPHKGDERTRRSCSRRSVPGRVTAGWAVPGRGADRSGHREVAPGCRVLARHGRPEARSVPARPTLARQTWGRGTSLSSPCARFRRAVCPLRRPYLVRSTPTTVAPRWRVIQA